MENKKLRPLLTVQQSKFQLSKYTMEGSTLLLKAKSTYLLTIQ